MLDVFTQSNAAGMWADGNTKLCRQQQNRKYFVDTTQAAGIDLTEADRLGLQELLEDDTILYMFAGCHADRSNGMRNACMTKHIVRAGRLFNPPGIDLRQQLHIGDGFFHLPHLVRVNHQLCVRTNLAPQQASPSDVVPNVRTYLQLEMCPTLRQRLLAQLTQIVVAIAKPTG